VRYVTKRLADTGNLEQLLNDFSLANPGSRLISLVCTYKDLSGCIYLSVWETQSEGVKA